MILSLFSYQYTHATCTARFTVPYPLVKASRIIKIMPPLTKVFELSFTTMPTTQIPVFHIVGRGAFIEVLRITARAVVTMMKDILAILASSFRHGFSSR